MDVETFCLCRVTNKYEYIIIIKQLQASGIYLKYILYYYVYRRGLTLYNNYVMSEGLSKSKIF